MFKIDETKIDLSVEIKNAEEEIETLQGKAPTSKVFFDGLSKIHKEEAKKYGKNEIPVGVLNAAAAVVVYGHDVDWYRERFSDSTLQELNSFLVSQLLDAKKK